MKLTCPHCSQVLTILSDHQITCSSGHIFPIVLGIPDLRVTTDTWIDFQHDRELANELATHYHTDTFEQLVIRVWQKRANVPADILERRLRGIRDSHLKYQSELAPNGWLGKQIGQGKCLEIGCGTGGFLVAAAPRLPQATGIDVSLTWLVTAKKRLEEKGLSAQLICACVEHLPFAAESFDCAVSFDVLEHVGSPEVMMEQTSKVLISGGRFFATTPNRFSLSAEPHVGIWGVGWIPVKWQARYVMWRKGLAYPHTRLLSVWELHQLLRQFTLEIATPKLWEGEVSNFSPNKRRVAALYNQLLKMTIFAKCLLPVAPFFQITAQKR